MEPPCLVWLALLALLVSQAIAVDCPKNTYFYGFFHNQSYCVKCPLGKTSNPCFRCGEDRSGMRCKVGSPRSLPTFKKVPTTPAAKIPTPVPTDHATHIPMTTPTHPTTGISTNFPTIAPTADPTKGKRHDAFAMVNQNSFPMAKIREQELLTLRNKTAMMLRNESKLAAVIAHAQNRYYEDEQLLVQEKTLLGQAIKAESSDQSLLNLRLSKAAAKEGRYKQQVASMRHILVQNVSAAEKQMEHAQAAYKSYKQQMTSLVKKTMVTRVKLKHKLKMLNTQKRSIGNTVQDAKKSEAEARAAQAKLAQLNKTSTAQKLSLVSKSSKLKQVEKVNAKLRATVAQDVVWLDEAKKRVIDYNRSVGFSCNHFDMSSFHLTTCPFHPDTCRLIRVDVPIRTMTKLDSRDYRLSLQYNQSAAKEAEEAKAYLKEKRYAAKEKLKAKEASRAKHDKVDSLKAAASETLTSEKTKAATIESSDKESMHKMKAKLQAMAGVQKKEEKYEHLKWEQERERVLVMKTKQVALASKLKHEAARLKNATRVASSESAALHQHSAIGTPSASIRKEVKQLKKKNKWLQARLKGTDAQSVAHLQAQLALEAAKRVAAKDKLQSQVDQEVAKEVDSFKIEQTTKYNNQLKKYKEKLARKVTKIKQNLKHKLVEKMRQQAAARKEGTNSKSRQ
jgi:hypothetical protein